MSSAEVLTAFSEQARACTERGSPFTGRLCEALPRALDRSTEVGRRVLEWPGRPDARGDSVPLRLAGGLHALARRGSVPGLGKLYPPNPLPDLEVFEAVLGDVLRRADGLLPWLDLPPQTNEPMRSAPLMAGLLVIADRAGGLPFALYEVGASAGLVLMLERYQHRLGGTLAGASHSSVVLAPRWEGSSPPKARIRISHRHGADLDPLDVTDPDDRERLLAYVWADQADRLSRVEAAIEITAEKPPTLDRAEAGEWTERTIDPAPQAGITRVLMHAVAMQYAGDETRDRIASHAARVGARATEHAPFAWLRFEADPDLDNQGGLHLSMWPGAKDELLALGDTHGEQLCWRRDPVT